VPDAVNQLLATEVALDKLGARGISVVEAEQTIWNLHVIVRNRRGSPERSQPDTRRLVIGESDANRVLTLVIEETVEPTTWLLITEWDSTPAERKILERS
jgi:uncharacterized DUF497 family protein